MLFSYACYQEVAKNLLPRTCYQEVAKNLLPRTCLLLRNIKDDSRTIFWIAQPFLLTPYINCLPLSFNLK